MNDYRARVVDRIVESALHRAGVVLIEGPKGCGKTETARQQARSGVAVDVDSDVAIAMDIDPRMVLDGESPRLFDEWHLPR